MDYYRILDLQRDCTDTQIKQAYRKAALKTHPDKNQGKKKDVAEQAFKEIAEAYDVLSDPARRAKFDQYGEIGLKNTKGGGYSFQQSPEKMFSDLLGSSSPFAAEVQLNGSSDGAASAPLDKAQTLEVNLYVSLEELHEGCSKKIKVTRRRLRENKTPLPEDAVISVDVKPGWKNGTRITFEGEGNEAAGQTAGDLVFILTEKPHPRFTRRANNLHYTAAVSLAQALTGCTVEVLTLDRRTLPIAINQIVSPGYTQSVVGEGLPNPKDPKKRGDLILEFKIIFPAMLTDHQKAALAKILPSS